MLTTGIASGDTSSYAQLLASLQQTGLVGSVKQWDIPTDKLPDGSEPLPDVVLLDLGRDPQPFFTFGTHLRRIRPGICLIACSATFPPTQQLMLDAMRSGVQDFISKPADPDALRVILERVDQVSTSPKEQTNARKLIVMMGAKGGVGTTTVAVNLGVHLAMNAHKHTALLDFARPLGNAHLFLDVRPRFGIRDAMDNLDRLDTHFFGGLLTQHKSKLELLGGVQQPEEWRSIPMAPLERVVNVAQANFDVVLMDVGAQFSSDMGPVLRMARMILMVTEANVPSLWSLERRLLALAGFGIDSERLRLIVNRWHKGDDEVLKSLEKSIKNPIFACLPNDYKQASAAENLGTPIMKNHNDVLSARYRQLAAQLTGGEAMVAPKKTGLSNVFSTGKR